MRVLLFKENEVLWTAQCLEHDIAAQGRTLHDVKMAFVNAIGAQIAVALHHGEDPQEFLETFDKAPTYYWDKFATAERLAEPIRAPERVEIPPAFMLNPVQRSLADTWVAD